MVEDRIGYRYAKSLFDLAKENQQLEESQQDMAMISNTISENRQLALLLKSPIIHTGRKRGILKRLFDENYASAISKKLVEIILRKGREMYLPQVATAFLQLYDREKHIQRGVITSAAPLSDQQIKQIKEVVEKQTGDSFELEQEIDKDLIGGFVLRIGDRLYDGSVSSAIRKLKQQFQKNTHRRKI